MSGQLGARDEWGPREWVRHIRAAFGQRLPPGAGKDEVMAVLSEGFQVRPGDDLTGTGLHRTCLFHLDLEAFGRLKPWLQDAEEREEFRAWLIRQGLDPNRVVTGSPVMVYREPDGRVYVTCRLFTDPQEACPHCHGCYKSEAVWTPLVGSLPELPHGWRLASGEGL